MHDATIILAPWQNSLKGLDYWLYGMTSNLFAVRALSPSQSPKRVTREQLTYNATFALYRAR
jgi:hypothetical protein